MDQQILFLINRTWTAPPLDRAMAILSSFDLWGPFIAFGVVALIIWGGFRVRAALVAIALALAVSDGLLVNSLKHLVGRLRPHEAIAGVRTVDLGKAKPRLFAVAKPLKIQISDGLNPPPRGNSFPSGHASNNFAVAGVCLGFYRRRGWLMLIPAALVSYSRIYVGSHWPSDVLISSLMGFTIGLLSVYALERVWKQWGARLLPKVWAKHPSLLEK